MKHHITNLYPRDIQFLTTLSRVGYIDHAQAHTFLRDKRIDGYLKDKLLERERVSVPNHRDEDRICYKLSSVGRKLCRNELNMDHLYHTQSPVHDLALADKYFSLTAEERATWRTETEVREMFEENLRQYEQMEAYRLREALEQGRLSMPDAIYMTSEQEEVAFEVVTSNYGTAEIEAKMAVASLLSCRYEEERV